jgi:hypothetical protein
MAVMGVVEEPLVMGVLVVMVVIMAVWVAVEALRARGDLYVAALGQLLLLTAVDLAVLEVAGRLEVIFQAQ